MMKEHYGVPSLGSRDGFAMAATLGVLTLLSALVVTVFANAMASFRSGMTDLEKSRTYYAAEAGAESGMAQLALALEDAFIEDSELGAIVPPTIEGFTFDSFSVVRNGSVTTERITDGPFAGLFSMTQVVEITTAASSADRTSSAIMVTAKAQAIPIFQFGVFFEKDLEITNGPRMDFDGWMHSNGNIYLNSANQYFGDVITTPNNLYHDRKDQHNNLTGTYVADASATYVELDFDSRDTPDANAFRAKSDDHFDNRVMTNAYDVDSLKVPLPDGVGPLEVIQPRDVADTGLEQGSKFAWKADWYIEVDLNAIAGNTGGLGAGKGKGKGKGLDNGSICDDGITHTRPATMNTPTVGQCEDIFTFGTDMWYEGREQRYVDIVDIDVDKLYNWTDGNANRASSIMYVTISPAGGEDPEGDGLYPVVRLTNAKKLRAPFTFATNHPLYVQGDYNSDVWYPSALVGDAITFLSEDWKDDEHQDPVQIRPIAMDTDVYAAILAGHSGTPCDHEEAGCGIASPYGGGLENFPRFLEDWNPEILLYRGSLVSLTFSQQATGLWGNGPYYRPPVRDWEFDTRFDDPANMPPGTPVVGNVIHTAFRPVF